MANWLNKYEQGGLVLKKKTKDNFGKKANPNDVKASVGPDFVGLGYNTKGRDYSPAWGGQFQDGGEIPQAQNGWLEKLTSTLNPYNWRVEDYSKEKDFTKAYSTAKKAGEEEFMYKGKRYNTKYAGTPRQEVGTYGVDGKPVHPMDLNHPAQVNLYPAFGKYLPGHISASVGDNETSIDYSSRGNFPFGINEVKNKGEKSFNVYGQDNLTFSNKAASLPTGDYMLEDKYTPSDWNLFTNNCADNVCDAFGIPRSKGIQTPSGAVSKIKKKYPTLDITGKAYEDYYHLSEKLQSSFPEKILPQAKNILGIASSPDLKKLKPKFISSIYISNYRNVNVGYGIYIDVSNIKLYGSSKNNYYISNYETINGVISKRYMYVKGNDKTYDSKIVATLTISNLVGNDNVYYFANFDNKNVGIDKQIDLTLSGIFDNNIFSPSNILWLSPDDVTTIMLSSGSNIAQVIDKSVHNNNSNSLVGVPKYILNGINNLNVIETTTTGFSGVINYPITSSTVFYAFIYKATTFSDSINHRLFALGNTSGVNDSTSVSTTVITINNSTIRLYRNNAYISQNITDGQTYLITAYFNGTTGYLGVNGTYVSFASTGNFNITKYGVSVSTYDTSNPASGQFGEILVSNYSPTTTELQNTEGYLATKWKLNSSLPSNHPYYSTSYIPSVSYRNNNYLFATNVTSANIYQRLLNASFTGINKIYNAVTAGSSSYTISGIYNGDIVDISNIYTSNFIDIHAGINKLIYINDVNLIGPSYFNFCT